MVDQAQLGFTTVQVCVTLLLNVACHSQEVWSESNMQEICAPMSTKAKCLKYFFFFLIYLLIYMSLHSWGLLPGKFDPVFYLKSLYAGELP